MKKLVSLATVLLAASPAFGGIHTTGLSISLTCPPMPLEGETITCTITIENQDPDHGVNISNVETISPFFGPGDPGNGTPEQAFDCTVDGDNDGTFFLAANDFDTGEGPDWTSCTTQHTVGAGCVSTDPLAQPMQVEAFGEDAGIPGLPVSASATNTLLVLCGVTCGNGVPDAGEECDDGNMIDGDCCSSLCEVEGAGTECRPAMGVCDVAEQCNGVSGTCPADQFVAPGTPCPDGDVCNGDDTCDGAGSCQPGVTLDCDDGTSCTADTCNPILGCQNTPALTSGCLDTFQKGTLLVKEKNPGREKVIAKFIRGPAISQTDWGNPLAAGEGTAYELCIFDASENIAGSFLVNRAGDTCAGRDCWRKLGRLPPDGKGYKYKDKDLDADGTLLVKLKGGTTGKSKAIWKAKNKNGTMPTGIAAALQNGVPEGSAATVQLHAVPSGSVCLSMELVDVRRNDGAVFKAKR